MAPNAARCEYCTGLTISRLMDLAKIRLNVDTNVSRFAYYQHHMSLEDLEASAETGCDICSLFITSLKNYEDTGSWVAEKWLGSTCDVERSLYSAASSLSVSDVKISIVCGEAWPSDTIATISVLDTILVQIGPLRDLSDMSPSEEPDWDEPQPEFPVLQFKLMSDRQRPVLVDGIRIGRFAFNPVIAASSNFAIAKEWLDECRTTHTDCLQPDLPELPSRVLDVGEGDADIHLHVSLGQRAEYAALSHCWGGRIEAVLLNKTLIALQEHIDIQTLPPNFKDAIMITRQLKLRFLWIDSLCIVQDSIEDWARESKNMGAIYCNSTLTLSALASKGSTSGILPRTAKHQYQYPMPVPIPTGSKTDPGGYEVMMTVQSFEEESLKILQLYSPLCKRGWCLQESVLSPRHLYFGTEQIYWRCPKGYNALDGTQGGYLRMPEESYAELSAVLHSHVLRSRSDKSTIPRNVVLEQYHTLVKLYTSRSLTYGSDKLTAFSGIARGIHSTIGGTYLAGLWSSYLLNELLWYKEMQNCKHVTDYRAPSWSWMVTDEMILFDSDEVLQEFSSTLSILDHTVALRNEEDPYGQIVSASLTVKGLTLPLILSRQTVDGNLDGYYKGYVFLDEEDDSFHYLMIAEDQDNVYVLAVSRTSFSNKKVDFEIDCNAFRTENYLALVVHVDEEDNGYGAVKSLKGLVVKPAANNGSSEHDQYERTGYFVFTDFKRSRLEAWKWETLVLI
ncbi:hypothetical protein ACN47E_004512 [Coniothyrium glycines]